jgi:amidase
MFVAKDVFDIEGHNTGAGSPDWLRTHPRARSTAPVIQRLLDAGASMVGRGHTDELAYSLNGQNHHYGTPINPRAPERIPGGSSSGSAVAVAGHLADFSIGTDCGGSVRLPASYCGILGFRPTHGRIPLEHAVPLAPSFDAVGWFARDPAVLEAVGEVLLPEQEAAGAVKRIYVATDLFALVSGTVSTALSDGVRAVGQVVGAVEEKAVLEGADIDCVDVFRTVQGAEVWATHGEWVLRTRPVFGPGVRERFDLASTITADQVAKAKRQRERLVAHMGTILQEGSAICLPTAPGPAPLRTASPTELESFRAQSLRLLSVAGLAGLPQITLPLGSIEGCPIGLSVIGARGADAMLLALARRVMH